MRVSGAIPAASVPPNELRMSTGDGGAHGHHSLGNSFVRVGGGGECATCHKALSTFSKVRACRFCDVVVHRKCAAECPPTCAAASLQHADEVSPVDSAGTVVLPARSLRGPVDVTAPGSVSERLFVVLGRDAVWGFAREPGRDGAAAIPQRCISLAGAVVEVRGTQVVMAVDSASTWRLGLADAAEAERWHAAVTEAAEAASVRLFRAAHWAALPQVPGRVLNPAPADRPLLERAMAGDPTLAIERPIIDADHVTAPLPVCVVSSSGPAAWAMRAQFVSVHAVAGGQVVCHPCGTSPAQAGVDGVVAWNQWTVAADSVAQLHGSVVLLFVLHGGEEPLHVHAPLCDEGGQLVCGMRTLYWWRGEASTFQYSIGKPEALQERGTLRVWIGPSVMPPAPVVYLSSHLLELLTDPAPVVEIDEPAVPFTAAAPPAPPAAAASSSLMPPAGRSNRRSVMAEEEFSPLLVPSLEEAVLRWATRDAGNPASVCRALLAVDYADPTQREEAVRFCREVDARGTHLPRYLAHFLVLHVQRSSYVRAFAMRHIFAWNSPLALVSCSLVSVLTFCPHDANGAALQMLRYMCTPRRVSFPEEVSSRFWAFHALAQQDNCVAPRFALYLKLYLAGLPKELATTVARHGAFSNAINELSRDPQRRKVPLADLAKEPRHLAVLGMGPHELPLGPAQLGPLDLERSKALPSNAAPLLLRFPVLGSKDVFSAIWKAGDDLTTDELVLTLGEAMNRIWTSSACDARIVAYRVRPTGLRVGAIEMVPGCTSLGKIQGNWKGALFKKGVITEWLAAQPGNKDNWEAVRTRFAHTLAGAVVFEYVMGLGDRHCDNLLLKPEGDIFHIDFGCSFGRDFGVAQETPFTLTSQMTDVLGTHFDSFVDTAVRAFVEVRRHRSFFVAQVMGALGGRLPHVQRVSDVRVVYDALMPTLLQPEAERIFRDLVRAALDTKQTQVNDALHTFYMQNFYRPPV